MHQCVSIWRLNIVSFAIGALNGIGEAMLEVAQKSKEESTWAPLMLAAGGLLLSMIVFIINQQISGWASQLFGGIGFSTRTADRMAGAAGRSLDRNVSDAGKGAGKAGGRSVYGAAMGAAKGRTSQGGPGVAKGALRGAYQAVLKQKVDPTKPIIGGK